MVIIHGTNCDSHKSDLHRTSLTEPCEHQLRCPPHIQGHLATRELRCKSSTTHNPCTSTNPPTDSLRQHNTDNDPSIKFLIATLATNDDSPTTRN